MTDVMSVEQRSRLMSRVGQRDTKPEMMVRRGLHERGLRYRLHDRKLPGRPDLVFARYHAAVFVHGCFWHAHGCALSKLPATRQDFWRKKLEDNAARDQRAVAGLNEAGWRVLVVWECALRGRNRMDERVMLDRAALFIRTGVRRIMELQGVAK